MSEKVDADFTPSSIDASVSIAYNLSEVAATFRLRKRLDRRLFQSRYQFVAVSAGHIITEAGASVSVTGHLVPQFDIGLSAFGDIASSAVFLNLNASIDLSLFTNGDPTGYAQTYVDSSSELSVNIGAEASFFDLSGTSTGETLFEKSFSWLQICVGAPGPSSRCCRSCPGITILSTTVMTLTHPTWASPTLGATRNWSSRWKRRSLTPQISQRSLPPQ